MNLLKKYHLWWLIVMAIIWFMLASWTFFALTGLNLIAPSSEGQAWMQVFIFGLCIFVSFIPWMDGKHKK